MEKKFIVTVVEENPGSSAGTVIFVVLALLACGWLNSPKHSNSHISSDSSAQLQSE